jgi:hypothetical protein
MKEYAVINLLKKRERLEKAQLSANSAMINALIKEDADRFRKQRDEYEREIFRVDEEIKQFYDKWL